MFCSLFASSLAFSVLLSGMKGREALRLDRPLEFVNLSSPAALMPPTPTATTHAQAQAQTATQAQTAQTQQAQVEAIPEEKDGSAAGSSVVNAKDKDSGKEKPSPRNAHVRSVSKDKERESAPAAAAATATAATATAPAEPTTALAVLSAPLPRLDVEKSDASAAGAPTAAASSTSAEGPSSLSSSGMTPAASTSFGSFSLDTSLAPSPAGSPSLSQQPGTLLSLLGSSSNPRGIGVCMASNLIQDTDNNDILLGLVAMFRHADRTPKQKVKLKTKSQTLMQLFEEQRKSAEKEAAAAAGSSTGDTHSSSTKSKHKHQSSKDKDSSKDSKDKSADKEKSADKSSSADKEKSSGGDKDPKDKPKDAGAKSSKDGVGGVIYKDLKWKKKHELKIISDAVKILLVKEQLREKRKKKLMIAQQNAAAAAALAAGQITGAESAAAPEQSEPAEGEVATATATVATAASKASVAAAAAARTAAAAAAAAAEAAWSEDDTDLAAAASAGSPAVPESDLALEDVELEAQIAAEKEKQLKLDAEKDPDYMSKLYQINTVLEKGYGGIKVQLKPKKVEKGKVVQALLIVKWGGEMTHAGVGQARQYAAAFWDDMIPPPYSVSSNSGNSAGQANAPGTTSSGKPGRDGLSASNPAVTSTLANMANFNAESEPSLQTNVSGSPEPGLLLERTPSGGAGSRHTPTPAKHRVNPSMSAAVAAANVVSPTSADSNSNSSITGALAPNANTPAPASALASSDVPVGGAVGEAVDGSASAVQGSLVGASHSPHNSSGSSHEFAYDHNSSLTQSDRHKLKSQLVAARATVSTARSTIEPIPESNEPGTPSKGSASAQNPPPSQQQPPSRKGASTTPPPATPASSKTSSDPAGSPSTAEKGGLGRKMSRSNLLSLTSAQSERSRGGAGAASGDRDNLFSPQSDKSDRFKGGDKDGAGGSGSSSSAGALSGSDPLNAAFASLTSPSSATPTGSAQASTSSAFTSAGKDGEDRMSSFRKQRLAFFQGLQIYSSDEARVVASAEAFYQSTFEHAHGFSDLTLEQSKEREEKKRAQSIRDWIEVSKKTQICHDKEVQRYLDETSQVAENMARAKEGIKFILMAEQSITAAQVTRHMLAQEQIARATSEAERADILKEEEELLRAARAEAETREREEKDQALTLRKQQLEEEHMEKLMDRLGELEEDGMDLERKLMRMNERIAAQARAKKEAAAAAAAAGAGAASPPVPPDDFDSAASDPEFGPGCLSAHLASGTDPKVISELEALLAKIYTKLREAAKKEANGGKKKDKKKHQKTQQPQQPDVVSPLPPAVVPGMEPAIDLSKLSVPGAGVPPQCPVTPPALSPPPSPSSFGPTAMTEWGVRCFPESDSRVLTDRGFLFLGEIEGLLASRQRVLYACYDSAKQCLRYEDGQLVIRSGKAPTHLVDFTERHTQRHWAAEASDAYGIDQQQDRAIGEKANHLSLRVTPDHDMFVQLGSECPSKVLAEELTSNFQCSCRSTAKCPHRCDAIRMLGSATNGLAIQHELGAMSCADVDPQSPVVRLSLRTEAQLDAFFEFYGYWLVNGSLGYAHTGDHSRVRTRGSDVVRVSTVKDTAYLHELLPRCGLVAGLDYSVGKNPNFVTFCISNRAWVAFFDDEYWIKFQEGRRRRAVLSWWVKQRMNKRQLRLLIQGMRLTDGSSAATDQQRERKGEGVFGICTSSVGFRDELMQLYLHAGFSPHFRLHTRKGDRESWWIDYSEESSLWIQRSDVAFKGSSAQAVGEPGAVVRSSPYNRAVDGRLWCVRVQHKDALILAQRAFRSPTGVVTKASRPVIVGNCLRWIGKPRNTLMKLYELLLMLQVQIHSKCEFAEKNTDKEEREKAAAAAATEKAAAEAAAAAATAAAAAAANPDDASVSSTLSSGTPHHRKVSGGSAALLDAGSKGVAGASAGDKQSSASTSAGSSTAAPSDKPATSTTEFEYVYEFDDDLDVEIMGKNFKKSRKEGAVQQRFGIGYLLCHKETLYLMKTRWDNLISSFYDPVSDTFDPTKLPDVYDCVVEGTLVATASGEALPIEKITVGTQVMARAASSAEAPAGGVVPRAVSAVLDRGIRECVELLFSDGRELVCTPDHRILTADGVWTTAAQLVVNESEVAVALAVKAGQVSCGDRVLPFCQVQLIARRAVGLRHVYDLAVPSGKDEFDSFTANGICVHNCIKYDVLHNMEFLSDIRPLYSAIKRVADFVVPNEYGILIKGKWSIGVGIARPLLKRMIDKLESALSPKAPSRVTLYFSSESHIHALRNVLLLSGIALNRTVATTLDAIELNYLSHGQRRSEKQQKAEYTRATDALSCR